MGGNGMHPVTKVEIDTVRDSFMFLSTYARIVRMCSFVQVPGPTQIRFGVFEFLETLIPQRSIDFLGMDLGCNDSDTTKPSFGLFLILYQPAKKTEMWTWTWNELQVCIPTSFSSLILLEKSHVTEGRTTFNVQRREFRAWRKYRTMYCVCRSTMLGWLSIYM